MSTGDFPDLLRSILRDVKFNRSWQKWYGVHGLDGGGTLRVAPITAEEALKAVVVDRDELEDLLRSAGHLGAESCLMGQVDDKGWLDATRANVLEIKAPGKFQGRAVSALSGVL